MYYTYILKEKTKHHFYVGVSNNLQRRINEHNANLNISTRGRKWELYCYFAFKEQVIAENFEKYLKGGSGRSFSKKHFQMKIDEA